MKQVVKIENIAEFDLYDITVKDDHCFKLDNGIVAHNSMYPKTIVSGGCVIAGTQIQLSNGELIEIEHVEPGMVVRTLDGNKPVTRVWNPETLIEGEPECFEITFEDGYTVTCSSTHEFLVDGQWIEAKDLVVGADCRVI